MVSIMGVSVVFSTGANAQPELRVPKLRAPSIDGRIGDGEWGGSVEAPLSDGGRVLMRHDGAHLFVAVRSPKRGFESACVTRGDTVRILHASAAVADAIYVRASSDWQQRQPFGAFALRSGDTTAANRAAMRAYLDAHRWVASNTAMSGTDHEMQISIDLIDTTIPRLALGYYTETDNASTAWPAGHADGCTALRTVQGFLETTLVFRPDGWARLTLLP
jgi:hypothetical protein